MEPGHVSEHMEQDQYNLNKITSFYLMQKNWGQWVEHQPGQVQPGDGSGRALAHHLDHPPHLLPPAGHPAARLLHLAVQPDGPGHGSHQPRAGHLSLQRG
jgi:hypothetical protein